MKTVYKNFVTIFISDGNKIKSKMKTIIFVIHMHSKTCISSWIYLHYIHTFKKKHTIINQNKPFYHVKKVAYMLCCFDAAALPSF